MPGQHKVVGGARREQVQAARSVTRYLATDCPESAHCLIWSKFLGYGSGRALSVCYAPAWQLAVTLPAKTGLAWSHHLVLNTLGEMVAQNPCIDHMQFKCGKKNRRRQTPFSWI